MGDEVARPLANGSEGYLNAPVPPPKVFVSHASEDKDRFVLNFGRALRRNGIDAWLDRWEMLPGDSLVDRIFEEGIRNASAIVVVLSLNSVTKPWVREELNAAVVKRINDGSLLIPVILDGVEVPQVLKSTVWEPITNPDDFDQALGRIVSAIFRHRSRPPLGEPPPYAVVGLQRIHGLAQTDVLVLREFGAVAVETGNWICVTTDSVWKRVEVFGVAREDFLDALKILSDRRWLEKGREISPIPSYFKVTVSGLEEYLTRFEPRYPDIVRRIAAAIVNNQASVNKDIANAVGEPKILVDHVLRYLKARRLADISEASGGYIEVNEVFPELRRWLRQ